MNWFGFGQKRRKIGWRIFSVCIVVLMVFMLLPVMPVRAVGDEPPKDSNGVYQIENYQQLLWFADKVNNDNDHFSAANAVLMKDIVSDGSEWIPIGYTENEVETEDYPSYNGTFDGRNHTISGLRCDTDSQRYTGLFGLADEESVIQNIGLIDSSIKGCNNVGGICGRSYGDIINCYNTGEVIGKDFLFQGTYLNDNVGGICGVSAGRIVNCYNAGEVSGHNMVGGIAGYGIRISNCYNSGKISGSFDIGGIGGDIIVLAQSCMNSGSVNGSERVGGIAGFVSETEISECLNVGEINASRFYGNIRGFNQLTTTSTVKSCYYLETLAADYDTPKGESAPLTRFKSGEFTYMMNNGVTDGTQFWYQKIGSNSFPTILKTASNTVYASSPCKSSFTNTSGEVINHNWGDDGTCINCGETNEPVIIDGYYQIENEAQLFWFASEVNSGQVQFNGKLMNDIIVSQTWTPIGNSKNKFKGVFDGQGYTVNGISCTNTTADYIGLFGSIDSGSKIENVGVINANFNGDEDVGGVCGWSKGTISNCYSSGTIGGKVNVGGICGSMQGGIISNCYSVASMNSSNTSTGTVCGNYGYSTRIVNCYFLKGDITDSKATIATDGQFNSGEIAYKLNGNVTDGSQVWYQKIGMDDYPTLKKRNGTTVYATGHLNCGGVPIASSIYSNDSVNTIRDEHIFTNGICSTCGEPEHGVPNRVNGYYEISYPDQLIWFANEVNNGNTSINGKLLNNISLSGEWIPIGEKYSNAYLGTFDGQGYTIDGIDYTTTSSTAIGLFGYAGYASKIINVGVCNSSFTGQMWVGGICGYGSGVTIENCYYSGTIIGTNKIVGGICGYAASSSIISNCYNIGEVGGTDELIGSICGDPSTATISNCYYLEGETTDLQATSATQKQFNSGEIAYLLNEGITNGTQSWYQICNIGYPSLIKEEGKTVYKCEKKKCNGISKEPVEYGYVNEDVASVNDEHDYFEGKCIVCGGIEVIKLIAPTNLSWDDTTATKAKWEAITNASSYEVQLYKDGDALGNVVSVTATEYDFATDIKTSGVYTFTVKTIGNQTSYTSSDESDESGEYNYTAPTVPGAPTNVSAEAGDKKATITFDAPDSDGGADITSYTVTSNPDGITANGTEKTITVTGLTNGKEYTFTVTATNSVGTGAASTESDAVIPKAPAVKLTAPTRTSLLWDDTTATKAKWEAITNASSYEVQLYKDGDALGKVVSVTTTEYDFATDIKTSGIYTFTVKAIGNQTSYTNSSESDKSEEYNYKAPVEPIIETTIKIGKQPGSITVTKDKITETLSVLATVSPSGTPNYQWYSCTDSVKTGEEVAPNGTSSTFNIPSTLKEGIYYYFCRVSADDAVNVDSDVVQVTVLAAPSLTHTIKASVTGVGGVITPSGNVIVNDGESKLFAISADPNYSITSVTIDGVDYGNIATYNFPNITGDHTIIVTFSYIGKDGGDSTDEDTPGGDTSDGNTSDEDTLGEVTDKVYKFIKGANNQWGDTSQAGLEFTVDGVINDFLRVEVDGKTINNETDYTVKSGSTIITLTPKYLGTLKAGTHKLTVVYKDGSVTTEFKVNLASDLVSSGEIDGERIPKTGDPVTGWLAMTITMLSLVTAGFIYKKRR